jgi:hypothetical protein
MLRKLTKDDLTQVTEIIQENNTFQGLEMSFYTRAHLNWLAHYYLQPENTTDYVFGIFDDTGKLLAWTHFNVWDSPEGKNFGFLEVFARNSVNLEKFDDTNYSVAVDTMLDFAFDEMEKMGVLTGYALNRFDPNWKVRTLVTDNTRITKWDSEFVESIPPFESSKNELFNKYLLPIDKVGFPQSVTKYTRKQS